MRSGQKIFYYFIKFIMRPWLYLFQHGRFNYNGLKLPRNTPVLFLSNHHSNWDPVYLNAMWPTRIIIFLASEEIFENKFMNWFFSHLLGEVKRSENEAGVGDVMELIRLKKRGANIGIYPEGDIDMFGELMNKNIAIAKLVKLLKMPVAIVNFTGAFLRMPRWARHPRHSKVTQNLVKVLSVEEIEKLPLPELNKIIWDNIKTDEMAWQAQTRVFQKAALRAEWLETGLFYCPKCHSYETLQSKNNDLYCEKCDYLVSMDHYGFFSTLAGETLYYASPSEWNRGQLVALKDKVAKTTGLLFSKLQVEMFEADHDVPFDLEKSTVVDLHLYADHLAIVSKTKTLTIPYEKVIKATLFHKEILDLKLKHKKLRFNRDKVRWNAYLFVKTIELIQAQTLEK